jgi:hypothetical protein
MERFHHFLLLGWQRRRQRVVEFLHRKSHAAEERMKFSVFLVTSANIGSEFADVPDERVKEFGRIEPEAAQPRKRFC